MNVFFPVAVGPRNQTAVPPEEFEVRAVGIRKGASTALTDRTESTYIEGTHPQASWIHVNTHPVYMYGYLWSRVYAQDMFTQFEESGLLDTETGERYRRVILANGTQRPILEAVEEFLGRAPNNEAYIRGLGLESG
jgi:hypothetical protein